MADYVFKNPGKSNFPGRNHNMIGNRLDKAIIWRSHGQQQVVWKAVILMTNDIKKNHLK